MQAVMLIRDIAIIVLALVSIIVGILMVLLILEIRNLVRTIQHDVKPILDSVNETASTVKGTTNFVSEQVVRPIASAVGTAAGARHAFAALLGRESPREQ
ncbi:MAG: hypothetical protein D6791_00425 [Chloroflexi bacterium]|nr:MAG: hypothetical protein D6791_00425 [Chloroflexota bacterium]